MSHPLALDPATVYEYTCRRCGSVSRLGPAGGKLDCDGCDTPADEVGLVVEYPDGTREEKGTIADFMAGIDLKAGA